MGKGPTGRKYVGTAVRRSVVAAENEEVDVQIQDRVKAFAFGAVLVAWALVKLGPTAAGGSAVATAGPPAVSATGEARQAAQSDGPRPLPTSGTPTELFPPAATSTEGAAAPAPASTPDAIRRELELQAQLESDARAYTRALLAGDVGAIKTLLAGPCRFADVAALIDRRRASLGLDLGVSISDATAAAPLVGHFDAGEGVAHAFLGFEIGGRQLFPRTIDGWLYESGHWRNAECT